MRSQEQFLRDSRSSYDSNIIDKRFLKKMSVKYKHQVDQCEEYNPIPVRSGSKDNKSTSFDFSPPTMPLSQIPASVKRLPRHGKNLLPAIAMLPKETA